jgi:hypothetical protein
MLNEESLVRKRKESVYLDEKSGEKEIINIKRTHFLGLENPKSVEIHENLGVICS